MKSSVLLRVVSIRTSRQCVSQSLFKAIPARPCPSFTLFLSRRSFATNTSQQSKDLKTPGFDLGKVKDWNLSSFPETTLFTLDRYLSQAPVTSFFHLLRYSLVQCIGDILIFIFLIGKDSSTSSQRSASSTVVEIYLFVAI